MYGKIACFFSCHMSSASDSVSNLNLILIYSMLNDLFVM